MSLLLNSQTRCKKRFKVRVYVHMVVLLVVQGAVWSSAAESEPVIEDDLIAKLLGSSVETADHADAANILQILEAFDVSSTPEPKPDVKVVSTTTTSKPSLSPFFITESPLKKARRSEGEVKSEPDLSDNIFALLSQQLLQQLESDNSTSAAAENSTLPRRNATAGEEEVPGEPHPSRKGRSHVDLKRRKRGFLHHHHGHQDHHHHGWGWNNDQVVVVHTSHPTSIFRLWRHLLFGHLKPALVSKARIKRRLFWLQLQTLGRLFWFLKNAKVRTMLGVLRAVTRFIAWKRNYLHRLRHHTHTNVVVVEPTKVNHHTPIYGWTWNPGLGWTGAWTYPLDQHLHSSENHPIVAPGDPHHHHHDLHDYHHEHDLIHSASDPEPVKSVYEVDDQVRLEDVPYDVVPENNSSPQVLNDDLFAKYLQAFETNPSMNTFSDYVSPGMDSQRYSRQSESGGIESRSGSGTASNSDFFHKRQRRIT